MKSGFLPIITQKNCMKNSVYRKAKLQPLFEAREKNPTKDI
tara:strand:- start:517 stop:639 length:123 start_codon:yes stop_codon:yes gene_type:complete